MLKKVAGSRRPSSREDRRHRRGAVDHRRGARRLLAPGAATPGRERARLGARRRHVPARGQVADEGARTGARARRGPQAGRRGATTDDVRVGVRAGASGGPRKGWGQTHLPRRRRYRGNTQRTATGRCRLCDFGRTVGRRVAADPDEWNLSAATDVKVVSSDRRSRSCAHRLVPAVAALALAAASHRRTCRRAEPRHGHRAQHREGELPDGDLGRRRRAPGPAVGRATMRREARFPAMGHPARHVQRRRRRSQPRRPVLVLAKRTDLGRPLRSAERLRRRRHTNARGRPHDQAAVATSRFDALSPNGRTLYLIEHSRAPTSCATASARRPEERAACCRGRSWTSASRTSR